MSSADGNNNNQLRIIASILGASGVGLGAFGAHALKQTLALKPTGIENWKTAVYYQLIHSVAILGLSALHAQQQQQQNSYKDHQQLTSSSSSSSYQTAGQLMGIGSVLFSGSIYLLTLDIGPRKVLGPTTPIGGLLMIAGWIVAGMA